MNGRNLELIFVNILNYQDSVVLVITKETGFSHLSSKYLNV